MPRLFAKFEPKPSGCVDNLEEGDPGINFYNPPLRWE
jgi:hypothetical protein